MSTTTRTAIDEPAAPYVNIDGYARHKVVGQRYSSTGKIAANSWRQDKRHERGDHQRGEQAAHSVTGRRSARVGLAVVSIGSLLGFTLSAH
jgi:hypothetical protein